MMIQHKAVIKSTPNTIWYKDEDKDGYGDINDTGTINCENPTTTATSYVLNNTDCLDTDINTSPETLWYIDNDNDGYGDSNSTGITSCENPSDAANTYVSNNEDCNDVLAQGGDLIKS